MTFVRPTLPAGPTADTPPPMPTWVTGGRVETLEEAAFLSGAALAHLHGVIGAEAVPHGVLRERLALGAAAACVGFAGRTEREAELRDAVHLLRPGDLPGPAGAVCAAWRRAVERPVALRSLRRALPDLSEAQLTAWREARQSSPVARAAAVLEAALAADPRAEAAALILADAALAQAVGWDHLVPLLARGLSRRDLGRTREDLRRACHRAIPGAAAEAVRMAADLARRAARLRAVTPKLRARGAGEAVALFLARDAVAPSALTPLMSDRAARRLCDRLVTLGAVRELTGRETFRLYGV